VLATLTSLRIKNLALVEELEWQLAPGFVAVTGETGAGKSVIIGALKLLLGERADKSLVRTGADSCTVEAAFDVDQCAVLDAQLEGSGLEACMDGQLIVKRTFTQSGGNRQFINGSPTTLAVLKQLGDLLVDLHGPHDHQSLLSADRQLGLLDAFSHAEPVRRAYEEIWRRLGALREERESLGANEAALERELELLRHQAAEIQSADLRPDEEEALQARYSLATNSRRLIELATGAAQELTESEPSILSRLGDTARALRELEKIDPAAAPLAQAHTSAVVELEELARALIAYADKLDLDPAELAEMEERVTLLQTLRRKYGPTVEAVIAFGEQAAARLQKIEGRGDELERLGREIEAAQTELVRAGKELSRLRHQAAPKLSDAVRVQLRDLGFKKSEFDIHLLKLDAPGVNGLETVEFIFAPRSSGLETVEFLFAPNPGEPPKPLRSVASSGEISRVMLAVKSALADQDAVPLLVFDEIDANVGGEIAHAVAAKMRSLGAKHQVLCITHLPQVAAAANSHYVVTKEFTEERTYSRLNEVKAKARVREIARMLGGQSDSALALAKTLLSGKATAGVTSA
jgi:DNA repair protein RecN (Recombination protein N)